MVLERTEVSTVSLCRPRRCPNTLLLPFLSRWSKSELKCYVNGQLVSSTEMSWLVTPSTGEAFDRCFLGSAPEINPDNMFSGQMATVYLFSEALSAQQVWHLTQGLRLSANGMSVSLCRSFV